MGLGEVWSRSILAGFGSTRRMNYRQRGLIRPRGRWSGSRIGENPTYGLTRGDGKRVLREEKTAPIFYSPSS